MLRFTCYKSREFIFLVSIYSEPIKTKRCLSQLQTKIYEINDEYIEYSIHERIHREEKELNRILPAVVYTGESQYWYKNDKCHRNDRDENGKTLPAAIYSDGTQIWFKNGEKHRDDRDEKGRVLPAVINNDKDQK